MFNITVEPFTPSSVVHELTSTIYNTLSAFENSPELSALKALENLPKHPYDLMKYKLIGPDFKDYKFKTIDDVPLPENFSFPDAYQKLFFNNLKIQRTLMHNLTCEPHLRADLLTSSISGDKIVPDKEKQLQQIEFIELIKSMDTENMSYQQALDYSKKIITEYLKIY